MGYCEVHDTRCSFAYDDCDDFEPITGNDRHSELACRLTLIGWYLLGIITALLLCWLMTGCTTTKYVTMPEVHEHWHHSTDTVTQTDSVIDRQTTTIREVDSATMAQYGIQIRAMQTAWLIQTERLQREISALRAVLSKQEKRIKSALLTTLIVHGMTRCSRLSPSPAIL
jgi:hypothetical protein